MLQTRPSPCVRLRASRSTGRSRRLAAPFVRAQLSTAQGGKVEERAVQFMVDMACQRCVSKVKSSLQGVPGAEPLAAGRLHAS